MLVIEGTAVSNILQSTTTKAPTSDRTLLLPTPTDPKPFPLGSGLDLTAYPTAALEHNALFLSRSWSTSPLGPVSTWDAQLRGIVQIMMASPFPVLVSYGPEYVLLYNEPYSKVIGTKHPSILGMKYGEAWPEIWTALEPVIRAGYQGGVLNVDCQEMFLMRGARLEGTLTLSMIDLPIRNLFQLFTHSHSRLLRHGMRTLHTQFRQYHQDYNREADTIASRNLTVHKPQLDSGACGTRRIEWNASKQSQGYAVCLILLGRECRPRHMAWKTERDGKRRCNGIGHQKYTWLAQLFRRHSATKVIFTVGVHRQQWSPGLGCEVPAGR